MALVFPLFILYMRSPELPIAAMMFTWLSLWLKVARVV